MNNNNNTNNQQNKNQNELGALWKKKSKNGMAFLSGYVKVDDLGLEKEIKVVVFANNKKANEKAPDYRIYISKPIGGELEQESQSETQKPSAKNNTTAPVKKQSAQVVEENDEDIL
jgi:uncharacterized protein (DUF736 family)